MNAFACTCGKSFMRKIDYDAHADRCPISHLSEHYPDDKFLIDEAMLGIDSSFGRVIYSVSKCLDILIAQDGMSYDEAVEYFEFNVSGSYVGEKTPIWCDDVMMPEAHYE